MRTIAIVLCDNDFGGVFRPLLKAVHQAIKYHIDEDNAMSKEFDERHISMLIREGIPFHYLAYSNHPAHARKNINQTVKYLLEIKILFDDEAEKHIQENDHDQGSWYLYVPTGDVFDY